MNEIPTQYTLTIKSTDRQEIEHALKVDKYIIALNEIRESLRKINKQSNLEKIEGDRVFDEISNEFWRIIQDNEINLD